MRHLLPGLGAVVHRQGHGGGPGGSEQLNGHQLQRFRVEDGVPSVQQGIDHDEVTVIVQPHRAFALPFGDSITAGEQPPVVVPGEDQPVRHGGEDLIQSPVAVWWPVNKPEIVDVFWIEPRFNVGEVATIHFQPGP